MSMVVRTQDSQIEFKMFETPFIFQTDKDSKTQNSFVLVRSAEKSSMSMVLMLDFISLMI